MTDIKQVIVAGKKVGLVGLDEILEKVRNEGLSSESDTADRLLELASKTNYITPTRIEDYRQALLRMFKRYMGGGVSEERGGVEIRIFGPGCSRCDKLMNEVRTILADLELDADLDHIKDVSEIAKLGPVPTPVLMINDKIVSSGRVPLRKDIIRWIESSGNPEGTKK